MQQFFGNDPWIGILVAAVTLWSLPWKGMAMWKAARVSDKKWFIALLFVNTAGILDILYLYVFSVKKEQKTPKGEIERAISIREALRGEK